MRQKCPIRKPFTAHTVHFKWPLLSWHLLAGGFQVDMRGNQSQSFPRHTGGEVSKSTVRQCQFSPSCLIVWRRVREENEAPLLICPTMVLSDNHGFKLQLEFGKKKKKTHSSGFSDLVTQRAQVTHTAINYPSRKKEVA